MSIDVLIQGRLRGAIIVNPLAPQDQRAKLRLLDRIGIWVKAPWIFLGHLLRLKNVGLALWVTDYDLSPDAIGGAK